MDSQVVLACLIELDFVFVFWVLIYFGCGHDVLSFESFSFRICDCCSF